MSEIPPKHGPEAASACPPEEAGGGLVAMYNAASHAGAESFPVLKAFQDYIEAERVQARNRMIQLSVFFSLLMAVVVAGFITAGVAMWRKNTETEGKLLEAVLTMKAAPAPAVIAAPPAPTPAPAAAPAAPLIEESVRQMARITADLQSNLDKKLDGVSDLTSKVHDKVASQDGEFEKVRAELKRMQEQNDAVRSELASVKAAAQRPAAQPQPPKAAPAPAAAVVPQPPKPKPAPAVVAAEPPKPAPRDPRFPPAVKDPPVTAAGVTPPATPNGMVTTAIPVKTKNLGTIPWRVMIPE